MKFIIAPPPSVNAIYRNVHGKGRVKTQRYLTWQRDGLNRLLAQGAKSFPGPVILTLCLPETERGDVSNRIKAAEDLLVKAGVIPDDSKAIVREVRARWVPKSEPCTISVEPANE